MRESEVLLGLASTVASPTVAIDRARMGMVVDMGMGTDRMAGRDEAAKSRDVDERRAAMVAAMMTMMDDDNTLFFLFCLFQDLSLSVCLSLSVSLSFLTKAMPIANSKD